jgi:hypothetical protein
MEIKVLPNENIFYLFALFNLIGYDDDNGKPFHPIRTQVRNDLSKFKNDKNLINLKDYWQLNKLTLHRLRMTAMFSKDGFVDFDPSTKNYMDEKSYEVLLQFTVLLNKAYESLKLKEYYQEKQQKAYETIIDDLQQGLQQFQVGKLLDDFWGISLPGKGILYPNPLDAYANASGGFVNGVNTSFSGPGKYDPIKNETSFTARSVIKSIMHEFSHAYVHKINDSLEELKRKDYQQKTEQLFNYAVKTVKAKNLESIFSDYNNWNGYFEEQIVRACETVFITPKLFAQIWSKEESSKYTQNKIEAIRNQGFIYIDDVVKIFQEVLGNKGTVKEAWLKTIDYCYKKYITKS